LERQRLRNYVEKRETQNDVQNFFSDKLVFELDERDLYAVLAHSSTTAGLICIKFYIGGPCLPVPPVACYLYDRIKSYWKSKSNKK
jgi:hypothetical protein